MRKILILLTSFIILISCSKKNVLLPSKAESEYENKRPDTITLIFEDENGIRYKNGVAFIWQMEEFEKCSCPSFSDLNSFDSEYHIIDNNRGGSIAMRLSPYIKNLCICFFSSDSHGNDPVILNIINGKYIYNITFPRIL